MTGMIVEVRLFAEAKRKLGAAVVSVRLNEPATVAELKRSLASRDQELGRMLESCLIAVNEEYADDRVLIKPGSEIALIPPVSGGSIEARVHSRRFRIERFLI